MTKEEKKHLLQKVLNRIDARRQTIRTDVDGWNNWVKLDDVIKVINEVNDEEMEISADAFTKAMNAVAGAQFGFKTAEKWHS